MTFYVIWRIWHQNMTWVNIVNLGVKRSIWTTAITRVDPILANKLFKNKKIEKRVRKDFLYKFWESFVHFVHCCCINCHYLYTCVVHTLCLDQLFWCTCLLQFRCCILYCILTNERPNKITFINSVEQIQLWFSLITAYWPHPVWQHCQSTFNELGKWLQFCQNRMDLLEIFFEIVNWKMIILPSHSPAWVALHSHQNKNPKTLSYSILKADQKIVDHLVW